MFVDGKEIYYTGGVFTPPSNHRPKHRGGARHFASDTPQVFFWAYIFAFIWIQECHIGLRMKKNNYNCRKGGGGIFLVLVPHRDVRLVLRNYSASLFRAGFSGAFCFPWAAPLAALSRALNDAELKNCARVLREALGSKICAGQPGTCAFGNEALFGPRIDIGDLSGVLTDAAGKVTEIFPQPVIRACLLQANEAENAAFPPPPELSFRAAAVANLHWRRTDEGGALGVKWKIGKLCWLPPARKSEKIFQGLL
jgi:hypothetical protein